MGSAPRRLFEKDNDLIERAKKLLVRDPKTGAFDYDALIKKVEELMEFNAAKERRAKAERLVHDSERSGRNVPDGQLMLPGFTPFAYEPNRLCRDKERKAVELRIATPPFLIAKLDRSKDNLKKQTTSVDRDEALVDAFVAWCAEEATLGALTPDQINFDTFVRTAGYWQPDPAPPADEGEDDGET
jgi:hypothetical protein